MMKKAAGLAVALSALVGSLVLGLGLGTAIAVSVDPSTSFGYAYVLSAGQSVFRLGSDGSTNHFRIRDLASDQDRVVVYSGSSTTGITFPTHTSTALRTLTPGTTAAMVINISSNQLCTSSGTTVGAWVIISTAASNAVGTPVSCTL